VSGAHTTRHEIEHATGTLQLLCTAISIESSAFSVCENEVHSESDFCFFFPANAGMQIVMARAHVAQRAHVMERMQTSGS
jgi:hypothetical protein